MTVAIIGTKGIPNNYGGFEAFAENLSAGLALKGYSVTVFQPITKVIPLKSFGLVNRLGVKVTHWLPQYIQRIEYNLFSLKLAKRNNYDTVICCGHSPALFFPFFSKIFRKRLIVNMDGLEWKREKWGWIARNLLKTTERLAANFSGALVADSIEIKEYIKKQYNKKATYIAYGASFNEIDEDNIIIERIGIKLNEYGLLIARLEPENSIDKAIKAFIDTNKTLVIVGGTETKYAKKIWHQFAKHNNIIFAGSIYHPTSLNTLRKGSRVYFHGHTVGGTNPSLLEAMAAGCTIVASDNRFNRETLGNGGFYYNSQSDLEKEINRIWDLPITLRNEMARKNEIRIKQQYSWAGVVKKYVELISCINNG